MEEILVFGHKSPDTDSIASAIVFEIFAKKLGMDNVKACRLGNVNKETQYVLDYLNIQAPTLIESVEDGQRVMLVDHNEFAQSVDGIENTKIESVVDHHRIYGFQTSEPILYHAEPVGCTSTIMYEKFIEKNLKIEKLEATLMLSAIISDTLLFKSPTCTPVDKMAAEELAKIAMIDIQSYGLEMLKAGTDLSDLTSDELIKLDAKEIMIKDVKSVIAQVNTASIPDMLKRKSEIMKSMEKVILEKSLDLFMFCITDIINSNSQAIVLGNRADLVEKSYDVKLIDDTAFLSGVVSRKKQIIPILTENV